VIMLLLALSVSAACAERNVRTEAEKQAVIEEMYVEAEGNFPTVASISAEELVEKHRMMDAADPSIVLLDVRPDDERQVSMIPGAISIEAFETDAEQYRDATVVTYCTVGVRSGYFAQELQERGFDVLNLRGSLLSWAHEGGDLVDGEGPTRRMHVYGRRWDLAPESYETTW